MGNEAYVERFTVSANMANGTYALIQMQIYNAGMGDAKAECRVLVAPPETESWQRTAKLGPGQWTYGHDPYPLLRAGDCYIRGGEALEAHAALDGARVTITVQAKPQTLRLRGNRIRVAGEDGAFYEKAILVPWAPARLDIRFPTGKRKTLHGLGYSDRARSTALPYEIAKRWLRVRALAEERSLLLQARFGPDDGEATGWVWRQEVDAPAAVTAVTLEAFKVDDGMRWKAQATTDDGTYRINLGKEIDRYSPMEELGIMGYALKSLIGNPTTHTFRAQVMRIEDGRAWPAIVEVHNENE